MSSKSYLKLPHCGAMIDSPGGVGGTVLRVAWATEEKSVLVLSAHPQRRSISFLVGIYPVTEGHTEWLILPHRAPVRPDHFEELTDATKRFEESLWTMLPENEDRKSTAKTPAGLRLQRWCEHDLSAHDDELDYSQVVWWPSDFDAAARSVLNMHEPVVIEDATEEELLLAHAMETEWERFMRATPEEWVLKARGMIARMEAEKAGKEEDHG